MEEARPSASQRSAGSQGTTKSLCGEKAGALFSKRQTSGRTSSAHALAPDREWARERGLTPLARFERVEKNSEELVLPASFPVEQSFTMRQATLGATMALPIRGTLSWAAAKRTRTGSLSWR